MRHSGQFKPGDPRSAQGGKRPGAGRPTRQAAEAKEVLLREAFDNLKLGMGHAVSTLVGHLRSGNESISLRAAQSIIEFSLKSRELDELERRIKTLEDRIQGENYR